MAKPELPAAELPDAFSLFKPSWKALLLNLETFLLQILIPLGFVALTTLLWGIAEENATALVTVLGIVSFLAAFVTGCFSIIAVIITELESSEGHRISLRGVVRATLPHFWRLAGLFVLSSIVIVVGLVLFIIPGLFALQRLLLSPYLLVEKRLGVIASIKQSNAMAKDKKNASAIWGVVGIIIAINIISFIPGAIALTISTVLTAIYFCAPAIRYLQIAKRSPTVKS